MSSIAAPPDTMVYPESDGEPLAENTKQLRWIVRIYGNLAALYRDVADVFVAADLFWYPVQGAPGIRTVPDVLVVFGRPQGDRRSYRQWEEGHLPVTVAFEIRSPSNTDALMADKLAFYEEHGVEEYYLYDPDTNMLLVYLRREGRLQPVREVRNFISPRLGIRFDLSGAEMVVYRPDNQPFLTFEEVEAAREQDKQAARQAEETARQAERMARVAEMAAEQARRQSARLAQLSRKARRQQATTEELAELERLEDQSSLPG